MIQEVKGKSTHSRNVTFGCCACLGAGETGTTEEQTHTDLISTEQPSHTDLISTVIEQSHTEQLSAVKEQWGGMLGDHGQTLTHSYRHLNTATDT